MASVDKGGRPPAAIDLALVERSASIGCTVDEIAAVCGVGRRTLYDRLELDQALKDALERGRDMGKATLRRLQWQTASDGKSKGAATMQIWLGKQMLGQKDKLDHSGSVDLGIASLLAEIDAMPRSLPNGEKVGDK